MLPLMINAGYEVMDHCRKYLHNLLTPNKPEIIYVAGVRKQP